MIQPVIQPVTCPPYRRRPWVRRQRREPGCVDAAQWPQVAGQGGVAAGVTLLGDLDVQHGGVTLTVGEPVVQVGA